MTRLLDKYEVSELLQVSPRTIDRLRSEGLLKAVCLRRLVRYDPADVQAFLDQRRKGSRS
jgi:excisionase family DNA binding protein